MTPSTRHPHYLVRMRLFLLSSEVFSLTLRLFTYGGGNVSKKDQTQFPDGGGTVSKKDLT